MLFHNGKRFCSNINFCSYANESVVTFRWICVFNMFDFFFLSLFCRCVLFLFSFADYHSVELYRRLMAKFRVFMQNKLFFFVSIRISNTRLLFMFGMSWHSCQHSRYVHVSSMAVFSVCGFSNVLIPQAILNIIHFSGIEVNGSTPFFFMCAARFLCDAKKNTHSTNFWISYANGCMQFVSMQEHLDHFILFL